MPPRSCAVAICLDGCEPAYLDAAIERGLMPNLARIRAEGTDSLAHSVIPSFTNPNNMSIATGRPPAVHGICGNYLYEPETGEEVMMNDVRFLRAPTIFSHYYSAGARVAVITAKDKPAPFWAPGCPLTKTAPSAFPLNVPTRRRWPPTGSRMPAPGSASRYRKSIQLICQSSSSPLA